MKKVTITLVLTIIATSFAPAQSGTPDAVSGASWKVELEGIRTHELHAYEVRHMMTDGAQEEMDVEDRNGQFTYAGILLSQVAAFVDGAAFEEPWRFDRERWLAGYEVTVTAVDGYAATFDTSEVAPDAILFAIERNGEVLDRPRLVGSVARNLQVRDISKVELALGSSEGYQARRDFRLTLVANDDTHRVSLAQLAESPLFARGRGQFTTSAGSVYASEYGGVYLLEFLEQFVRITDDTAVTFVASDGYEMTFGISQLRTEGDVAWILAFEQDGAPIPIDPGYIRTVKIGPDTPNIPGHLSVKMVAEIRVSGEPVREYTLKLRGQKDVDLDRTTLQSALAFEGVTVTFTHRGESNEYSGIPLHYLLAYADDPEYTPHGQDSAIDPYNREAAMRGFEIDLVATDGFAVTLDSREVYDNDEVIVALKKNGEILPESEWPLVLVWDEDAAVVPNGIRNVRNIDTLRLKM